MKKIGLSQRVHENKSYAETRDCLDRNWARLLESLDFAPVPLCNSIQNVSAYFDSLDLSGVILTGGNDLAALPDASGASPERDRFETSLLKLCLSRKIPVLGVCRGIQFINEFFGGSLVGVHGHVAKRHRIENENSSDFPYFNDREVNSFHQYGIDSDSLGKSLLPLARAEDGGIEALRHSERPVFGIMWHPERESTFFPEDLDFLKQIF